MQKEIRELLYKHTDKVDNWNDAIFARSFDDLVDELDVLFAKRIVSKLLNDDLKVGDNVVCTIERKAIIIEEIKPKIYRIRDNDLKEFIVKEETLRLSTDSI